MSEEKKKRRGWRSVAAVVSAVALGVGGVAVPQVAGAYTFNDQISTGWGQPDGPRAEVIPQMNVVVGDQAKVDAEIAKPLDQRTDDLLGLGIDFTLLAAVQATAPNPVPEDATIQEPGQSDIHADARASEKDGNVTGDDIFHVAFQVTPEIDVTLPENGKAPRFEWDNLTDNEPELLFWESEKLENGNTAFKFYFKDTSKIGYIGPDPVVTFAIPASLKDVEEGQERPSSVRAAEYGLAYIQPAQSWTPLSADAVPLSRCVYESTHRWQFNGGGYGSWLLDANLGTLDRSTRTLNWDVNFFDANGNPLPAIKENIAQTADRRIQVWKDSDQGGDSSQDTGGSYYTVDEENPNRPQDPNEVLWQADASWNYNPTTKTGDTWIEDGTIIELTHQTENGDCVQDPNYTVDLNDQSFANVSARVAPRPTEATAEFEWAIHEVIGDYVWYDTNRDGIQGADERGAAKVEVTVTSADGQWTTTTTTDENGSYRVIVPSPGTYNVEFAVPEGYEPTGTNVEGSTPENDSNGASTTVTVSEGQDDLNLDLGLVEPVPDPKPELASVGDRVWIDANRNGVQDEGEENLAGVNVTVTPPAGSDEQPRTATTDAAGKWRIDELTPGVEYTVSFELPDGYKATDALVGEDRGVDSNGLRSTVTLKPGEYNETYDLGVFQPASVGDFVWEDTNGNGIQDDGEPAVPNTIVRVTGPNGETHTTATDKDGKWSVDGLTPGVEYTVKFTVPEGYSVTKTEQGEDRGKDSNPLSSAVSLKPGENNTTYDLGLIKPASVGDRVWVDENADGIQDENEKNGVPNAKVTVTAPEGVDEQPRTTTTDDKGNWRIDGLTPGVEYTVTFELPEGVSATKSLVGDDRGVDSNELSTKITLESGQHDPTIDLGVVPASIGDRVWLDEGGEEKVGRADGIQDEGEGGIADVVVRVSRPGEEVRETKTGAGGTWKIEGLTPGVDDYRVEFDAPDGYRISPTKAGDAAVDSNGLSDKVAALKSGEFNDTYDLGLFIEVPETTTVTTPVPTVETTTVPTPCDCSPTTVPKTVTSKVPAPTTTTQVVSTTKTQSVPTTTTQVVPTTKTTEVPVPTTVPTTTTQAVPTTLTTEVPVPTTVPTTVTSEVPVPTTTTQAVPTTVEKPVPVPTTVHSTTTAEAPKRGTIGDKVWEDTNGDGKEDPDEKTGIPNVPVVIVDKDGNEVTRTVTDKDGNWKVDVEPGEYTVRYETGDRTPSDPELVEHNVTVKPGEKRDDIDLGVLPSGSVGDRVWNDEDGDGEQGEDEKGIPNVIVEASREGEPTRTTHTDENGDWKIEGLNPSAEYDIRFIKPEGWEVTGKVPGSDESGLVSKVTVKPNEYNDSYDLGLQKGDPGCNCEPVKPGRIGDRVWIDLNGNGKQDPNETEGVPDVTVIVRDADGNEVTRTVTDEDGNWKVDVEPGDYEIEYRPRDWKPTDPKRVIQKVTVEEGKEYLDLDLGVQKPKPGEPTPPIGEPEPQPEKGSSTETLDRCVANAVRSPLLYLVPVALLGAFGGEIARPYMGVINEQINQINAQFQEAMRRNSPDWGQGGRGGRDDDQFAELRGQIDAANRRIAELGQDPNVQRFGTVAAGVIGLIAAGGVLYDWCSNEKGEAFTAVGGSSSKDAA